MAYIREVKTSSGATAVQVCVKTRGVRRIATHVGLAHSEVELAILRREAQELLVDPDQLELDWRGEDPGSGQGPQVMGSVSRLLWEVLERAYREVGFGQVGDEAFKQLVLARVVEPTSKAEVPRVISGLGVPAFSAPTFYRCLKRAVDRDYQDVVCRAAFDFATRDQALTLALFDTTTSHFQTDKTDGLRAAGRGKEGRFGPQVQFGLLTDADGFPLEFVVFPGNKGETRYLIPVIEALVARHGQKLRNLVVVADAGILSARNCLALEANGFSFIVGSKTSSAKKEILQGLEGDPDTRFVDGQIFERQRVMAGKDLPATTRRVVYQYKQHRAQRDLKVLQDQRERALKVVETPSASKKPRFVKTRGNKPAFDEDLYNQAKRLAGLKGYVTNLPETVAGTQIVTWYSNLFQIERAFRMSKNDLGARPFYHHTKDAIHAHLVIVFTALAISRYLEQATGLSKKKLIELLQPLRDATIQIGEVTQTIPTYIPPETQKHLNKLKISGH